MPPDIEHRAKEIDWIANLGIQAGLMLTVLLLMWDSPLSVRSIGLSAHNWRLAVALGVIFSLIPIAIDGLLQRVPSARHDDPYPHVGSLNKYGLTVLSQFAAEFWRAFCITALIHVGCPPWVGVVTTAVVCAVPHLYESDSKAVGAAVGGLIPGFLFVETASLLAPVTMGLISSTFMLYDAQRRSAQAAAGIPSLMCPACSHSVPRKEANSRLLVCPGCGARLMLSIPMWMGLSGGLLVASSILLYLMHTYDMGLGLVLLLFAPVFVVCVFLCILAVAALFPGLEKADFVTDQKSLFRF